VYVQYVCELRGDQGRKQQLIGLQAAMTMIFCSFVFLYLLYYSDKKAEVDYTEWDYQNATVADFSV
jgi:hypothetical protein